MTNQVNQAFEKWFGETYKDLQFNRAGMIEAWQAATQASESEINSLKEQVKELQSFLSSQSIEIAHNDVTLESYAHKVTELQADNERLRGSLETISDWTFGWDGDCGVTSVANNALSSIPAQSLAEHDNATIDRCKNIVADDALAITFQSMGAYRSAIIKHIGELKATP